MSRKGQKRFNIDSSSNIQSSKKRSRQAMQLNQEIDPITESHSEIFEINEGQLVQSVNDKENSKTVCTKCKSNSRNPIQNKCNVCSSTIREPKIRKTTSSSPNGEETVVKPYEKIAACNETVDALKPSSANESDSEKRTKKNHEIYGGEVESNSFDFENLKACNEYVDSMFEFYRKKEEIYSPSIYMHYQKDLNVKMRAILIDWVVEVHNKFRLCSATLYLTCNILDRYLTCNQVVRTELQLVGISSLLIASKYEEIFPPEVNDCVFLADYAYHRDAIIEMELKILRSIQFEITVPTCWNFLMGISKVAMCTAMQMQRASYYSERCLQEHDMLAFKPSLVASAAIWLARLYDGYQEDAWTDRVEKYTSYNTDMLMPCAQQMIGHLKIETITTSNRQLYAVKKKFASLKYLAVATEGLPTIQDTD